MTDPKFIALENAQPIIKRHVLFSMGAGFIPIPIADIAAVTAVQLDMLKQLCKLYEQDYNESSGKALVSALAGTTLARIAAHGVGSIFKAIPLIGSALGGMTVAVFSGAVTYAIGQVVAQHFASGGSIAAFDSEDLKEFYEEQFQKGMEIVNDWKTTNCKEDAIDLDTAIFQENSPIDEVAARLEKLENLKAAGFVTDTEYKRIKKRILKEKEL